MRNMLADQTTKPAISKINTHEHDFFFHFHIMADMTPTLNMETKEEEKKNHEKIFQLIQPRKIVGTYIFSDIFDK